MPLARSAVYSEECPHCKAANYYDVGDGSEPDTDALRCWKCKKVFVTEGVDWTTPRDATLVDDGRAKP